MAWYNPFEKKPVEVEEKLNPAQQFYGNDIQTSREPTFSYERAYEELEVVNRAVNMTLYLMVTSLSTMMEHISITYQQTR